MTMTAMTKMASNEVVGTIITEAWNATGVHVHRKSLLHMTFYWGHKTQVLFSGWPGSSSGMYALALIFVFVLAVMVEWLHNFNFVKPGANRVGAGFFKTGVHAVRSGLGYMVMLSVMSFNGGVFLAAVFGHAVGFLLFGSRLFKKLRGYENSPDLPSSKS